MLDRGRRRLFSFWRYCLAAPSSYRVDRGRHLASSTFGGALAKVPAEFGGRRRGDFCFGYSDLALGAVGAGGELGGVRSRSWRDRAAQVALSLDFQEIFWLARVFIPWRRCPPNPAVGGAAISVLAIRIWRSARLAPAVS